MKITFEDTEAFFGSHHHEKFLKRFMGKGLDLEAIMTKPIPNSYPVAFREIGLRINLLCVYAQKDESFKKGLETVMYRFIVASLDEITYAPRIEEAKKLKEYFIERNDGYTYFSDVGKAVRVFGSTMWKNYQAIADYNWFVKEGTCLSDFVNHQDDKRKFMEVLYSNFGYKMPEIRIKRIY